MENTIWAQNTISDQPFPANKFKLYSFTKRMNEKPRVKKIYIDI